MVARPACLQLPLMEETSCSAQVASKVFTSFEIKLDFTITIQRAIIQLLQPLQFKRSGFQVTTLSASLIVLSHINLLSTILVMGCVSGVESTASRATF